MTNNFAFAYRVNQVELSEHIKLQCSIIGIDHPDTDVVLLGSILVGIKPYTTALWDNAKWVVDYMTFFGFQITGVVWLKCMSEETHCVVKIADNVLRHGNEENLNGILTLELSLIYPIASFEYQI